MVARAGGPPAARAWGSSSGHVHASQMDPPPPSQAPTPTSASTHSTVPSQNRARACTNSEAPNVTTSGQGRLVQVPEPGFGWE